MKEVHPFSWVFADDDLTVENDYFAHRNDYDEAGTYTDPDARPSTTAPRSGSIRSVRWW